MLTAIELELFDVAMRREIVRAGHALPDRVLHVDLIEERQPLETPAEPVPPLLRLPAPAERRRTPARAVPRESSRRSGPEATPPAPMIPRLVGIDGHILVPDEQAPQNGGESVAPSPSASRGDAFARANPVPYAPTRFDASFPDVRESLGGEVIRKTTVSSLWYTPWGTLVECKASLMLLGIGVCTWGPAPRLTIEQLKALRADPPSRGQPSPDDPPARSDPQPLPP